MGSQFYLEASLKIETSTLQESFMLNVLPAGGNPGRNKDFRETIWKNDYNSDIRNIRYTPVGYSIFITENAYLRSNRK